MLEINGTFLVFLVSFMLFCYLLNKLLWLPIAKIKASRKTDLDTKEDGSRSLAWHSSAIRDEVNKDLREFRSQQKINLDQLIIKEKDILIQAELKLSEGLAEKKISQLAELENSKKHFHQQFDHIAQELSEILEDNLTEHTAKT